MQCVLWHLNTHVLWFNSLCFYLTKTQAAIYIYIYIYIYIHIYILFTTEVAIGSSFRSSYRKLAWVGFEPMTTEFRSEALTDLTELSGHEFNLLSEPTLYNFDYIYIKKPFKGVKVKTLTSHSWNYWQIYFEISDFFIFFMHNGFLNLLLFSKP